MSHVKQRKPNKDSTLRFYSDVRREYSRLASVMELGQQKYSESYIIARLAFDFYKSEKTIENIVYGRV